MLFLLDNGSRIQGHHLPNLLCRYDEKQQGKSEEQADTPICEGGILKRQHVSRKTPRHLKIYLTFTDSFMSEKRFHKFHVSATYWFIVALCETWVLSPRFTSFTLKFWWNLWNLCEYLKLHIFLMIISNLRVCETCEGYFVTFLSSVP